MQKPATKTTLKNADRFSRFETQTKYSLGVPPQLFNRLADSEKNRRRVCFEDQVVISEMPNTSWQETTICCIMSGPTQYTLRKSNERTIPFDIGCIPESDDIFIKFAQKLHNQTTSHRPMIFQMNFLLFD